MGMHGHQLSVSLGCCLSWQLSSLGPILARTWGNPVALARATCGAAGNRSGEPDPLSMIPDSRLASGLQTSSWLSPFQVRAFLPETEARVQGS